MNNRKKLQFTSSPRFSTIRLCIVIGWGIGVSMGLLGGIFLATVASNSTQRRLSSFQDRNLRSYDEKDVQYGWNQIHVFYGNTSHIGQASRIPKHVLDNRQWFSQVRQDELVSRLLKNKRNGFFVDLAANDAVRISNTYALEAFFDWKGLCVEANPQYWAGLAYRPGCTTIAAVVGTEMMQEVHFRFPQDKAPKGGIIGDKFDNQKANDKEDKLRYTVTLEHILEKFQAPAIMDYLSLDVEGAETFVMSNFPFDRYRFNVLTVERADQELIDLFQKHGYHEMKKLKHWGETLWVHEAATGLDLTALEMETERYQYTEREKK